MKSTLILLVAIAFPALSMAQDFKDKVSLKLPDSLSFSGVEFADINNDSLLDVVLLSRNASAQTTIFTLVNKRSTSLEFAGQLRTYMTVESYHLTDLDGDNQVDVIVSGARDGEPLTTTFLNHGAFNFDGGQLVGIKATLIRLADLDGDGAKEMLVTGQTNDDVPFLRILGESSSGWKVVHDSIRVHASALEIFDFDDDNDRDLFVSGVNDKGDPTSQAFINQGSFYFTAQAIQPSLAGISSPADLNGDGVFDITLWGRDAAGNIVLRTLVNNGSTFNIKDSSLAVNVSEIISADFNSDGKVDLHFYGQHFNGDSLNIISGDHGSDTIIHRDLHRQSVGDFDRDGDIDLVQLRIKAGISEIAVLENTSPGTNLPPTAAKNPIAARIFNRIFLSWDMASDDRTPMPSVTYDLSLQFAGDNLLPADFDLLNGRRLLVSHGNNTTQRYALIRDAAPGEFYFMIQSVDNSFHAGKNGICKGSGGTGCLEMEAANMELCRDELVTLQSENSAGWYSFSDGFLGETKVLSFPAQHADTLFSVESTAACARIRVYVVQVSDTMNKTTDSTIYVCEGQTIHLEAEKDWESTDWSSALSGHLSNNQSIEYIFSLPDTVTVVMTNGSGCEIRRRNILKLSKPGIEVTPEAYQILRGQSAHLSASGGETYEWAPSTGLDDPTSPTPVASPFQTTAYVVIVKDSLGCQVTGGITVIVEETAFVPNLFTPNNDGSNDVLKIYGLGAAREFSFTIFNREGNQVFHTKSVSDAVNIGWNGTLRGTDLPAGVYYWSVTGRTDSGKGLQLNGKSSGSIVLVR